MYVPTLDGVSVGEFYFNTFSSDLAIYRGYYQVIWSLNAGFQTAIENLPGNEVN